MPEQVFRVSLAWLGLGVAGIIGLALLGGLLGAGLAGSRQVPLTSEGDKLVSTVQEVTLSPNIAVTEMLQQVDRSVIVIASERAGQVTPIATGVAITSDGLIVTAARLPVGEVIGIDNRGRRLQLARVGRDELIGLEYVRATEAVLIPVEMRDVPVPVAYQLMGISRSDTTWRPKVNFFRVNEVTLPPQLGAAGVQQMWRGEQIADAAWGGSPLVDDEGRLSGLLANPQAGLALPVNHVRFSLDRVVAGRREVSPLQDLGMDLRFTFVPAEDGSGQRFGAEVSSVVAGSIAGVAGLKTGDVIYSVAGQSLDWESLVISELGNPLPWQVVVTRDGQQMSFTLEDVKL